MKTCALVAFVKTPDFSSVKTRLANRIGKELAVEFYRNSIKATEAWMAYIAQSFKAVEPLWAVAELSQMDKPIWKSFRKIGQGSGGLGERLHHVYGELIADYDLVIFLGGDSPHLSISHFQEIRKPIDTEMADFVFGPTSDGGFYLFAGSKPIDELTWVTTEYSLSTTLVSLTRKLEKTGKVAQISELFDIDTFTDLKQLSNYKIEPIALPAQQELIEWSRKVVDQYDL